MYNPHFVENSAKDGISPPDPHYISTIYNCPVVYDPSRFGEVYVFR
jgi:hypothetical protein